MSHEPRDLALAAIYRATVRVAEGSGVIVRNGKAAVVLTANHVVKGDGPHVVRGATASERTVLARSEADDVALLGAPVELERYALEVAQPDDQARLADTVWASGFPRGWDGDIPVLAPGTIAGLAAPENWVNVDGSWGNSGGPLCRLVDGSPLLVGLLLGRAGEVNSGLESFKKALRGGAGFRAKALNLMDDHFRTGFLRYADATAIRKLL